MLMPTAKVRFALLSAIIAAALLPATALGEVRGVAGGASMLVVEYNGAAEVQRDFNQDLVPDTTPTPPAIATALLDHQSESGAVTAAGQGIAMLHEPNLTGAGTPNDAGLDLAAFSDDVATSWVVEGTVHETRNIVLTPTDLGGDLVSGGTARVESTILLSGVLVLTAMDAATDLSGVEARLRLGVWLQKPDTDPVQVLAGTVLLAGGPNGDVFVAEATGVFAGQALPVFTLPDLGASLPLAKAVVFTGLRLNYEYDVTADQPFDLQLTVESRVLTAPQGTGAAAVFGLPQSGLSSVFERVKNDDRGERLQNAISEQVDTTGAAYLAPQPASLLSLLFPFCGATGFEGLAMLATTAALSLRRGRPTRRACRSRRG